jgi:hypothetical protein
MAHCCRRRAGPNARAWIARGSSATRPMSVPPFGTWLACLNFGMYGSSFPQGVIRKECEPRPLR